MAESWSVAGTARSAEKVASLARRGIAAFRFADGEAAAGLAAALGQADAVLISTPPDEDGDPVLKARLMDGVRPDWLGYLSTTGVYGDRKGGWVDETSETTPSSARAARRLAVEIAWRCYAADAGLALHIFRLPGIYGPGRSPLDALRAGTARRFDKPGQVFSRIHVEDVARVLMASIAKPRPGAVYNVCDDEPAPQADVIAYGAKLLGIAPPPLEPFAEAAGTLSEMALSFYRDSKRVRNDRMKRELGIRLAYPSYREGLKSLNETN